MASLNLAKTLQNPLKEMQLVRRGLQAVDIETFLMKEDIIVKDILTKLAIPASTYFSKKKNQQPLDSYTTEKFMRLISVIKLATDVLGKAMAKQWLNKIVPSLGNEIPLSLLDTEIGHR